MEASKILGEEKPGRIRQGVAATLGRITMRNRQPQVKPEDHFPIRIQERIVGGGDGLNARRKEVAMEDIVKARDEERWQALESQRLAEGRLTNSEITEIWINTFDNKGYSMELPLGSAVWPVGPLSEEEIGVLEKAFGSKDGKYLVEEQDQNT